MIVSTSEVGQDVTTRPATFGSRLYTPEEKVVTKNLLDARLGEEHLASRKGGGNGWKVIELANSIFGFDGWSSTIVDLTPDFIEKVGQKYSVAVTAVVKVVLRDGSFREDVGTGFAEDRNKGTAIDRAKKEAVTDGRKRALRQLGRSIGGCIYDKEFLKEVKPGAVAVGELSYDSIREDASTLNKKRKVSNDSKPMLVAAPQPHNCTPYNNENTANSNTAPPQPGPPSYKPPTIPKPAPQQNNAPRPPSFVPGNNNGNNNKQFGNNNLSAPSGAYKPPSPPPPLKPVNFGQYDDLFEDDDLLSTLETNAFQTGGNQSFPSQQQLSSGNSPPQYPPASNQYPSNNPPTYNKPTTNSPPSYNPPPTYNPPPSYSKSGNNSSPPSYHPPPSNNPPSYNPPSYRPQQSLPNNPPSYNPQQPPSYIPQQPPSYIPPQPPSYIPPPSYNPDNTVQQYNEEETASPPVQSSYPPPNINNNTPPEKRKYPIDVNC